jgi:hypothetical protein
MLHIQHCVNPHLAGYQAFGSVVDQTLPYRMLRKLFHKDVALATDASPLFCMTPYILFGTMVLSAAMAATSRRHAKRDLQALSSETGGIAFFPATLKDVDSVAAEVARDIRNQYAIAYHSPRASKGGYHTVKVEAHASGHGKLTVYTRSGYRSKQSSSGIAQKP